MSWNNRYVQDMHNMMQLDDSRNFPNSPYNSVNPIHNYYNAIGEGIHNSQDPRYCDLCNETIENLIVDPSTLY